MQNDEFIIALQKAKDEMAQLLRQRREIDERLGKLAPLVENLTALCVQPLPEPPMPSALDMGLSDAIRLAFKTAGRTTSFSLTPTEVRDALGQQGFNLSRYASELPPIHNTIARLERAGEIEPVIRTDGTKAHRWVSSLKRAVLDLEDAPALPTRYVVSGQAIRLPNGVPVPPTRKKPLPYAGPGTYVRTDNKK